MLWSEKNNMSKKELYPTQFLNDLQGKNINFLIGAGASAGLIRTLDIPALGESFEYFYSSKKLNFEQQKVLDFIWFQLWIKDTLVNHDTAIELYKEKNGISQPKLNVLINYYHFIDNLVEFLNLEGYDKPKRANIFTTNYDSIFELIFDLISLNKRLIYFNDGSRGFFNRYISTENFNLNISHSAVTDSFQRNIPTINLLKIHGSITWDKSEDKIKVSMDPEILNDISLVANELYDKVKRYDLISNVFFKSATDEDIDDNAKEKLLKELSSFYATNNDKIEEFILKYSQLQVVNPTKEKFKETVFQQNYYQMLRMLSFELEKKNSVLIVFGFSFADEHIREIIKRSLINPYLKMYVICYDEASKKKIEEMFQDIKTNSIEYLPYSFKEDNQEEVCHGDFKYLNYLLGEDNNE